MTIEQAVNAVWQGARDEELRNMTPQQFYTHFDGVDIHSEDLEDAWYEFSERVQRVFFADKQR